MLNVEDFPVVVAVGVKVKVFVVAIEIVIVVAAVAVEMIVDAVVCVVDLMACYQWAKMKVNK